LLQVKLAETEAKIKLKENEERKARVKNNLSKLKK
jgi:hypothetical protein